MFNIDCSDTTVLTLYLSPISNLKLRPKILTMRAGLLVDRSPARVADAWTFQETPASASFSVKLEQNFQRLENTPATPSRLAVEGGCRAQRSSSRPER